MKKLNQITCSEMKELLEMAAEEMDSGNRVVAMNIWFSVCRDMLEKIEELELKVKELEGRRR